MSVYTFDANSFNDSLEVYLDGRPLGTLVKNYVGSYVAVDTSGTIQGVYLTSEAGADGLLGGPRYAVEQDRERAEAEQRERDSEWERYCRDKADPYDIAWGDC